MKPVTRAQLARAIQALGRPVVRVLVVDDDPDALELLKRMLFALDSSLEVVTALSGKQALAEVRRAAPDLVLLDVVMPGMSGWQVLDAMINDEGIRDVPTLFVSAQDPSDEPLASSFLLTAMGGGLSMRKLLACSLQNASLLLSP